MDQRKKILLTGGSGFIGANLIDLAIEEKYSVYALVRRSSQMNFLREKGVQILYGDITDKISIMAALKKLSLEGISLEAVIHAAGTVKAKDKMKFMDVNVRGTTNLLESLAESEIDINKFIFISSLAACGPERIGKVIQKEKEHPVTYYGESKLLAEKVIKSQRVFPYIIIRPTAVYGPRDKELLTVFKIVNSGISPVLGYHKQELTFIHAYDLCNLILSAVRSNLVNKTYFATDGEVYHKEAFGTAIAESLDKSVIELRIPLFIVEAAALLSRISDFVTKKIHAFNMQKCKELKAESWNCDMEDTVSELHFKPLYTLQRGVQNTTDWYRENQWI